MPPKPSTYRPFSVLKKLVDRGKFRLAPETDKPLSPPRHVDDSLSEEEAFHQAMEEVRPLGWSEAPLRLPGPIDLQGGDESEEEALEQLKAFVDGEGDLDAFATGEGVEGAATKRGRRYLGRLKKGEFSVQAHLDLHGMDPAEAVEELEQFIRRSLARGHSCVRIVHGRGKHSTTEPAVLKAHVARWLSTRKMSRHVVAFASARWLDGGSGALYVLLYRK
jgi:DNA-nicking Smr family endonuclease